ncbi:hypothetical protein PAXRUDRAFT_17899 [Paxillus rubicundulus Ve08.2h10]|uniref:Uncharacterized protein n=1 Tax=Paxillus rubicundulus Ve08.2h10 TaxID=930991 RepID=A0A0D0C0P0_9AGAM|nr:hypothetical protein PAXRUDRAFT_17899 [Paxillus rubicundulus Ve08.2h10]
MDHVNELINQEIIIVWHLLKNTPAVHVPPILITSHLNIQTATQIQETQELSPLLELHGATDSIATHPWSQFHLGTNAGTSFAEVIKQPGPSTISIPKMVSSSVKVEEGKVKMGNVMPMDKGKKRGKAQGAHEEMGGDSRAVAREGKEMEVGEEMEVEKSNGNRNRNRKEVVEATVEKGMPKNQGKGRESNKDIGQARGCSQSTMTSRYKSMEQNPMDSEDEGITLHPQGPSPTSSLVQDIMTTPKVSAAQPNINMLADAGQAPCVLSPMENIQVSPHITIINVDATTTTDILNNSEVAFPQPSTTLTDDVMVMAAEVEGVPDPSTPPALPAQLPLPSPERQASALLALTATYEDEEDMEVED